MVPFVVAVPFRDTIIFLDKKRQHKKTQEYI